MAIFKLLVKFSLLRVVNYLINSQAIWSQHVRPARTGADVINKFSKA